MKSLTLTVAMLAVISMSGCQTLGGSSDALLSGIPAEKIAPIVDATSSVDGSVNVPGVSVDVMSPAMSLAASQIRASGSNPVCGQFNMNSLAYIANPAGSGMGIGLLKTIAVGAIAGVASGGVSALGIGSSFVENTVAGTVNQVVFNAAKPVMDSVFPAAESTDMAAELSSAAERVGCPNPTSWLKDLNLKDAQKLLTLLSSEFTAIDTAKTVVKDVKG